MKLAGVSVVMQLHEPPLQDLFRTLSVDAGWFESARPNIYRLADRLLVLNSAAKSYFEAFGCNVTVVSNPPSFDLEQTPVLDVAERSGILWLARLDEKQKNWTDALRVMERLAVKSPGIQCWMGGSEYDAGAVDALKRFISDHHLEATVHWIGRRADVKGLMSRCRVFLMTSSYETFPMSLVEAKICGAPVVIYDIPYLEMLKSKAGCRVVRQRDTEGAAAAVAEILADDDLCRRLIKESRQSVEDFYSSHDLQKTLVAVLQSPGASMRVVRNDDLRHCLEQMTDFVRLGPLTALEDERRHRRIRWAKVMKYAVLGKFALTHRLRIHYRNKLRKIFE